MPIPYFDAHCDTIFACIPNDARLRKNSLHVDLERLSRYSPAAQVFAVWSRPTRSTNCTAIRGSDFTGADAPPEDIFREYNATVSLLLSEFEKSSDILTLCRSAAEAEAAAAQGKIAAFIAVEGAEQIKCSLDELERAYALGVRALNLCWNYDNALCGSSRGASQAGLTELGREFVRRCQAMGIIVDLSHSSDATFWDTLEMARRPVLAGHSDSRAVCNHPRNITDDMFRALVKNGGCAGINLCDVFLGENPDIYAALGHAEHYLSLGGEKNVCLGTDFDGVDVLPRGIGGIEDMEKLYELMLRQNWSESLVRDIFRNNLMRVFEEAL